MGGTNVGPRSWDLRSWGDIGSHAGCSVVVEGSGKHSHWHEVSRAVNFVGVERADGGEDDQGEGQQKDLPEMGWGHRQGSWGPAIRVWVSGGG